MNRMNSKKIACLALSLIFGFLGTRCTTSTHKEEVKTYPKDYVHSLREISLDKVINENRGLEVIEENATTVDDYYRGGVQKKEEGEKLLRESRWAEARKQFEKSNRFLRMVLKYLPEDEAHRTVYEGQTVIFLPNLLIADNDLKLITVYRNLKEDDRATQARAEGEQYLAGSLKSVKTEWANQVKKGFEDK